MGRLRMTRAARARAGVLGGGAMVAAGAGLGLGMAVGLALGGVLLVAYCLLLADTGDGGGP
ncbi:hypothetical protein AB0P02_06855 [Streptomyces griseoluteus]|uniref:hypothetical protein n=1 Tax=Streptomyces griseoluteus TaxID=29306 RepID=UPI00343CD06B